MTRLTVLPLLLLLPADRVCAAVADTVLQQTLVALQQRLGQPEPLYASRLVAQVGERTGRAPAQVRRHLLDRLDDLADLADADPEAWSAVLALGGDQLSRRQAQRLVRQVIAGARDVLGHDGDYLVEAAVHWAAREARVPGAEAAAYVDRLVAHGLADTAPGWTPVPVGVVVSGWTEPYELGLEPLFAFFATREEGTVREAVRDLQRFLVPRLVRHLRQSPSVRFAVRDRDLTALVDPEYQLRLVVQGLRFAGTNADLLPCMDLSVDLVDRAAGATAWKADLSHCTQDHGSASVHELDPFYDEVAELVCARLDQYLQTPR